MAAEKPRLHLILLAGGKGLRADKDELAPKQFRTTRRGMLFTCALQNFLNVRPQAVTVTVAVPDAWRSEASAALTPLLGAPGPALAAGAGRAPPAPPRRATRSRSWPTSDHAPADDGLIAVHDGARPFASDELLDRLCVATLSSGSSVPAVPVSRHHHRDAARADTAPTWTAPACWRCRRPQVFRWDIFRDAHRWARENGGRFTDDGSLMAERGHPPVIVPGDSRNWKITTDVDWKRVEELLR